MKPSLKGKIEKKQEYSKRHCDGLSPKHRFYDINQQVLVRNIRGGKEKWIKGTVVGIKGPNTYLVRTPGNDRRFVHADHMKHDDQERDPPRVDAAQKSEAVLAPSQVSCPTEIPPIKTDDNPDFHRPSEHTPCKVPSILENPEVVPTPPTPKVDKAKPEVVPLRKSSRTIKPPVRLTY